MHTMLARACTSCNRHGAAAREVADPGPFDHSRFELRVVGRRRYARRHRAPSSYVRTNSAADATALNPPPQRQLSAKRRRL